MEDEDNVVAIVQGLQDAGLTLTVLNPRLLRNRNSSHRKPLASKSTVETNTERIYEDHYKVNRGTNVRDGRYASSYQIAHCSARPTSPPENTPEFPQQRFRPSRREGNFEVGSYYGAWDSCRPPARGYSFGSMFADRSGRKSHETFAHSLRRYPAFIPEESISTELVEKLLSYTQNKYSARSSTSKTPSLNRDKSPRSSKSEVKSSKNIQTYNTRSKRDVLTRECGANTSRDLSFTNKYGRSYSAIKDKSYKDVYDNDTSYSYLGPPAVFRHSARMNEVRYLKDVKKYIRDTIRQIYDDKPVVCPRIRGRYSHHRRQHHRGEEQAASHSIEVQASIPSTSKARCEPPPGSLANGNTSEICCECNKPIPCLCGMKAKNTAKAMNKHIAEWIDQLPILTENSRENKREKKQMLNEVQEIINEIPKDENYDSNVRDAVKCYVESLPMWHPVANEEEEAYRNEVIDKLIDTLEITEDKMTDAVKDIVREKLKNLQFDRNIDMKKTVDNFASHLTPLLNYSAELKTKIKELLENLPITNKIGVLKDIQDDFANDLTKLSVKSGAPVLTEQEIENEINAFLEEHPDKIDPGDKVKNLSRKLKNIQNKPISENEKKDKMKQDTVDWIDTLPKNIRNKFTPNRKDEFANDLMDKVQGAADFKAMGIDRQSSLQTQNEIENEILRLLDSMDVYVNDIDESVVKEYAFKLKEIKKSNMDEEELANETIDFLNQLDKSGVAMSSREQNIFQENVTDKLKIMQVKDKQNGYGNRYGFVTSTPRKASPPGRFSNVSSIKKEDGSSYSSAAPSGKDVEKQYNNKLHEHIETWIDTLPIHLDSNKKQKQTIMDSLANDIMDRQKYLQIHPNAAKSEADELEHLKYQIFRWLNKMDKVKDHEMAPVMDKTKNLMDIIKNVAVPRFIKPSSRETRFGSPTREQSLTEERRLGSPTREQSSGSTSKRKRFTTSTGTQSNGNQTYIPTQDPSMFIKENLDGAIADWIKQLPIYEKAKPEQKQQFEELVPNVSKSIKRVYDENNNLDQDIDKLVRNEIENQLKDFPLSPEDKKDVKFMGQTAEQLLQYLKDLKMFQNISERTDVPYDEYLKQRIDDWANSFSLSHLSSSEKEEFEGLKDEFTSKLKQAREDKVNNDKLKSEIYTYVQKFPLAGNTKRNYEYLDRKVDELLRVLSTIPVDIVARVVPEIDNSVRQAISKWMEKLPLDQGKTVTDIPKDAFENLAQNISDALVDETSLKTLKNTVEGATVRFLDEIPLDQQKTNNTKALADELFQNIRSVPKGTKNSTHAAVSNKRPLTTNELKVIGDNLSGAVLDWMTIQSIYFEKKPELDKLATVLSNNIKSILKDSKGIDQDQLLIDEIMKQLKDTPLESNGSENAAQLVQYMKDLQMLQANSTATILTSLADIQEIVDDFTHNNLDLRKGTWADKHKFGKLKSELATKLKEFIDGKGERETLKKEIKYYLGRFPISEDERRDDRYLEKKAEELIEALPTNTSPDVYDYVRKGTLHWMKDLPLENGKNINDISKQAIEQLTRALSDQFIRTDKVAKSEDMIKIVEEETDKFLLKTPLDPNKSHDSKKLAKDLFDSINGYSKNKYKPSSDESLSASLSKNKTTAKGSRLTSTETLLSNKSGSIHPSLKSAADQLADNVEQWVNNLPIKGDTSKEKNKANNLRRHLFSKIISKVGELNANPEIFNDDFLYEETFEDEVDGLITVLSDEDFKNKMPPHKTRLMEIVKDARVKTQEEMAGTVYKQLLRGVVSKTVPSESLNAHENASFEVLKDDVADAFVSLHYIRGTRGDTDSKTQFKYNVRSEIDVFCADYLKSRPKSSVDTEQLNNDLYKALKDVRAPKDETMKHEIEIIKIKELIKKWIVEGKLFGDQTGVDKLKTKKKISVLAKKIHDIEKLKESNPGIDSDDMLKTDIKKWLQKMPLVVKDDLDNLAKQLIEKLKETEESRKLLVSESSGRESAGSPKGSGSPKGFSRARFSGSISLLGASGSPKTLRRSIGGIDGDAPTPTRTCCKCPEVLKPPICRSVTTTTPRGSVPTTAATSTATEFTIVPSPCAPPCAIPPSTLSPEEKDYLKKIRERATHSRAQTSTPRTSKDVGVSPIPVDYGSQTEIPTDSQAESTSRQAQTFESFETGNEIPEMRGMQTAGSQVEIIPHVIVKEFHWDSVDSKTSPCATFTCPPFTCPTTPCQSCLPKIPEVTCPPRSCNFCPSRKSQYAQTALEKCPEECDPDCRECPYFPSQAAPPCPEECSLGSLECPYYLPALPAPCSSKPKRSKQSCHNVGPRIRGSNKNLAWSKEDVYGDRRPSDEEEIIIHACRRNQKTCECKDRVTLKTYRGSRKRICKSCRTPRDESVINCPKCCGVHCPYPSYFYFNTSKRDC